MGSSNRTAVWSELGGAIKFTECSLSTVDWIVTWSLYQLLVNCLKQGFPHSSALVPISRLSVQQ